MMKDDDNENTHAHISKRIKHTPTTSAMTTTTTTAIDQILNSTWHMVWRGEGARENSRFIPFQSVLFDVRESIFSSLFRHKINIIIKISFHSLRVAVFIFLHSLVNDYLQFFFSQNKSLPTFLPHSLSPNFSSSTDTV